MAVASLIGFIVGYIALVIVSAKYRSALASIAAMIAVYFVLSCDISDAYRALLTLFTWNDLRVFVFIFFSMFLAGILKEKKMLDRLVESTSGIGCRFSLLSVPAFIGLLPMPGGALVSAIAMKKKYLEDAKLSPEWATFLNYWFRHVWVPSWPLFQSVVITASVFAIDPSLIVIHTWPGTIASIIAGLVVSAIVLSKLSCRKSHAPLMLFVTSIWPFALLALLVFLLRLSLLQALILTLIVVIIVLRPSLKQFLGALRLATRPIIHLVLFEALYFKDLLIASNAPESIMAGLSSLGFPETVLVFSIPFVLGLSAGGENFFAATAMPLLMNVISSNGLIDWSLLYLAYSGGFLGVMLSPVHLCLVLTLEYYKAGMAKTMAMVAMTTILSILLIYLFYIIIMLT